MSINPSSNENTPILGKFKLQYILVFSLSFIGPEYLNAQTINGVPGAVVQSYNLMYPSTLMDAATKSKQNEISKSTAENNLKEATDKAKDLSNGSPNSSSSIGSALGGSAAADGSAALASENNNSENNNNSYGGGENGVQSRSGSINNASSLQEVEGYRREAQGQIEQYTPKTDAAQALESPQGQEFVQSIEDFGQAQSAFATEPLNVAKKANMLNSAVRMREAEKGLGAYLNEQGISPNEMESLQSAIMEKLAFETTSLPESSEPLSGQNENSQAAVNSSIDPTNAQDVDENIQIETLNIEGPNLNLVNELNLNNSLNRNQVAAAIPKTTLQSIPNSRSLNNSAQNLPTLNSQFLSSNNTFLSSSSDSQSESEAQSRASSTIEVDIKNQNILSSPDAESLSKLSPEARKELLNLTKPKNRLSKINLMKKSLIDFKALLGKKSNINKQKANYLQAKVIKYKDGAKANQPKRIAKSRYLASIGKRNQSLNKLSLMGTQENEGLGNRVVPEAYRNTPVGQFVKRSIFPLSLGLIAGLFFLVLLRHRRRVALQKARQNKCPVIEADEVL